MREKNFLKNIILSMVLKCKTGADACASAPAIHLVIVRTMPSSVVIADIILTLHQLRCNENWSRIPRPKDEGEPGTKLLVRKLSVGIRNLPSIDRLTLTPE